MGRPVAMKIGERFGMLTVLARSENTQPSQTRWLCRCDCGTEKVVPASSLRRGSTKSCGCSTRRFNSEAHKRAGAIPAGPERNTWAAMNARCHNPNAPDFALYGGRGVTVCERWQRPHGYKAFVDDMGPRPAGMTLDRIDTNGDYSPENCRWAHRREQQRNRRMTRYLSYQGETRPLAEWAEQLGLKCNVLYNRAIIYKWPVGQALGLEPRD